MKVTVKIRDDKKIHAIKLVRSLTGSGLKESKDLVETVMPYQTYASTPGTVRVADLTIEPNLPWDTCVELATEVGLDIEKVSEPRVSNTLTVTDVDNDNMIISLKSTNVSGELFVNKQFAADSDILSLLSLALKV